MSNEYLKLLEWHAGHIRSLGHIDAAAAVLRTRSKSLYDILAYIATDEKYTVRDLRHFWENGTLRSHRFRWTWLAALGRVIVLQALENPGQKKINGPDFQFGLACLKLANENLARIKQNQQFHRLEIEIYAAQGQVESARELLVDNKFLAEYYHGYLLADIENPALSGTDETYNKWLQGFNRPFIEKGLEPISSCPKRQHYFNQLAVNRTLQKKTGPLVSVIMTTYKPDPDDFLLAVQSILNQSWQNLELLIIDDASPAAFKNTLTEASRLDPRVRLIVLPENGGTYRARNIGIEKSKGDYVTGQDSDDWSHPERLAHQMEYLGANPAARGVVVEAIKANDALVRTFPGRIPYGYCEVSLLLKRQLAREVGGYMDVRKGADGEFRRRIEKFTGQKVNVIDRPLYVIRVGHASLSREEFMPGWSHPVRQAFWNVCGYWHENTPAPKLRLTKPFSTPIPVPNPFKVVPQAEFSEYDVVFVGDWRSHTSTQRAMIDEIAALKEYGNRVGVLHLESTLSPSKESTRLSAEIQSLINTEIVEQLLPSEKNKTSLVVIHDPVILQFSSTDDFGLEARHTLIKTDIPPSTGEPSSVMYLPEDCENIAKRMFLGNVVWSSNDPIIRSTLSADHTEIDVDTVEVPLAFRLADWRNTRLKLVGDRPIIGRHSSNYEQHWPELLVTTERIWGSDESIDVEILGDARSYLRKYGQKHFPLNWVVYRDKEIEPEAFMSGLDFFVYYPHEEHIQGLCREALEAAAAGALVLLPNQFHTGHGDTALYAEPDEVLDIIMYYVREPDRYREETRKLHQAVKKRFCNTKFAQYIQNFKVESNTGKLTGKFDE